MRVLIAHSRYASGASSGENRVVEDEARLLREAGHDVRVWEPAFDELGAGARVKAGAASIASRSAARTIRRLVREQKTEVVHLHNLFPRLSPTVLRAAAGEGAAVLVTLHNYRLFCLPAMLWRDGHVCEACVGKLPWRGLVHRCYRDSTLGSAALATSLTWHRMRATFDHVDLFLSVSDFVRRKHVEAGVDPGRIVVKPNFAWPGPRRVGPGEYFLFLGRLWPEKGADTVVAAAERLPIPLLVVGNGPDAEHVRGLARGRVEFRQAVEADAVPQLLARARALLLPSRALDPAPRVILEAYATGVPVLASDRGGSSEFVEHGVSGLLAQSDRPDEWAQLMARLCEDAESTRLGEGALRLWREQFGPDVALRNLLVGYEHALDARARRTAVAREVPLAEGMSA